jgi:hypothetical protein
LLPANNNNSRWGNVFFPSIGSARPYYVNGWPITLGRHEKKKKKKELKNIKHKEKSSGQTIFLKGGKLL